MLSIHMTTYARLQNGLLPRAIESVLAQDFEDYELIVCDDASVDGTSDYLTQLALADERVRVFRNPRNVNSVAVSLGRCFQRSDANRPYVTWMFDDCVLLPGALSLLAIEMARRTADVLFGVTNVKLASGDILPVGSVRADELPERVKESSILVPNGGILVDRRVFAKIGWYDPNILLRRSCDWDLFRRMLDGGVDVEVIPEVVMEEEGDLHPDTLRNSFTTTFEIMRRYADARDASGLQLDLLSCLSMPTDWIPPGAWTSSELAVMQFMFLEYFLSIGDLPRALTWAKRLDRHLSPAPLVVQNLRRLGEASDEVSSLMAAGAYTAAVAGAYKEQVAEKR